jgi:hypothetical protein
MIRTTESDIVFLVSLNLGLSIWIKKIMKINLFFFFFSRSNSFVCFLTINLSKKWDSILFFLFWNLFHSNESHWKIKTIFIDRYWCTINECHRLWLESTIINDLFTHRNNFRQITRWFIVNCDRIIMLVDTAAWVNLLDGIENDDVRELAVENIRD